MGITKRHGLIGLIFVFPWIVGFLIFFLRPLIQSVSFSLNNVVITAKGRKMNFVAFGNYTDIFTKDAYFVDRLVGFFKDIILQLPLILVFSLMIAILLNQSIKCSGLFRTIFFLPIVVVSGPVLSMLMQNGSATIPLIEQYGVYDIIEESVPYFLQEPISNLFGELLLILWYSGVPTLIFFSGLKKIDVCLYEASYMDGASSWVTFWKIVLPSLRGMVLINSIYVTVFLATSELNEVIILIRSNMLDSSRGFGIASAMAWIYTLCILLLILICYLLFGREKKEKVLHYDAPQKKRRKKHGN